MTIKNILFIAFFGALIFRVQPINAQNPKTGIMILPSIIEERVNPSQWLTKTLTITNVGSESLIFYFVKRDINAIASDGTPIFKNREKTGLELSSWINAPTSQIYIGAGQSKKINFSIFVPRNASPGSHVASLLLANTPGRPQTSGAAVGYQVGVIIHLRIAGAIVEEADVQEFHTDHFVYSRPRVQFTANVANLGNVVIHPRGPIEITNMFNKKTATIVMNDSAAAVLPKTNRDFNIEWKNQNLAFGRYQAILSLAFGEEEMQTISRGTSFWILPMYIIVPTFSGLITIIVLVMLAIKWHIKKKLQQLLNSAETMLHQSSLAKLEQDLIHKKQRAPISHLAATAIAMAIFAIIFILIIFILFA